VERKERERERELNLIYPFSLLPNPLFPSPAVPRYILRKGEKGKGRARYGVFAMSEAAKRATATYRIGSFCKVDSRSRRSLSRKERGKNF